MTDEATIQAALDVVMQAGLTHAWGIIPHDDAEFTIRAAARILRRAWVDEMTRTTGLAVRTKIRNILTDAGNFPSTEQLDAMAQQIVDLLVPPARLQEREQIAAAIEAYPGTRGPAIDDPRDPRRPGLDTARRIARDLGKAATT